MNVFSRLFFIVTAVLFILFTVSCRRAKTAGEDQGGVFFTVPGDGVAGNAGITGAVTEGGEFGIKLAAVAGNAGLPDELAVKIKKLFLCLIM